eukprot:7782434-Karenia_brevis.AAC.1
MQRRWNCASLTLLLVTSSMWYGWANNDYGIGVEQSLGESRTDFPDDNKFTSVQLPDSQSLPLVEQQKWVKSEAKIPPTS